MLSTMSSDLSAKGRDALKSVIDQLRSIGGVDGIVEKFAREIALKDDGQEFRRDSKSKQRNRRATRWLGVFRTPREGNGAGVRRLNCHALQRNYNIGGASVISLLEGAALFAGIADDLRAAPEQIVEKACQMIEKEAKDSLGHYQSGWPRLQPETIAHKEMGDSPLLETGEMRDSISHEVYREGQEVIGIVGSDSDKAVWQELGTSKIPPRSFLMGAAQRQEHKIVHMAERRVAAAFAGSGAAASEWREFAHIVRETGHKLKELWDDTTNPDKEDR